MEQKKLHFYAISFPKLDHAELLYHPLSQIRKNYFELGASEKKTVTETADGICTKYSYYISHWGMGWKKSVDHNLVEYSLPSLNGVSIFFQKEEPYPYVRFDYNTDLDWVRTVYFHPELEQQPAYLIEWVEDPGILHLQRLDTDGTVLEERNLYAAFTDSEAPIETLTEESQASCFVFAETNLGRISFSPFAEGNGVTIRQLQLDLTDMGPEELMESTHHWDKRGSQLFAECVDLLREEPFVEKKATVESSEEEETEMIEPSNSTEPSAPAEPNEIEELMAMLQEMEAQNRPLQEQYHNYHPESEGKNLQEALQQSGKGNASRYMVAGKKKNRRMTHASDVFDDTKHRAV